VLGLTGLALGAALGTATVVDNGVPVVLALGLVEAALRLLLRSAKNLASAAERLLLGPISTGTAMIFPLSTESEDAEAGADAVTFLV
jgi:hypothetical protein